MSDLFFLAVSHTHLTADTNSNRRPHRQDTREPRENKRTQMRLINGAPGGDVGFQAVEDGGILPRNIIVRV